jgi:NADH-quinone oxidoreductase subunit C
MTAAVDRLAGEFPDVTWETTRGQDVAYVPVAQWAEFARAARDAGFEMCSDVTAVDWMRARPDRFQVVATLTSLTQRQRLRMTATLGRDDPTIASVTPIWPGAGYAEREVYDMFGVVFEGHPDLTRILMPDDWDGHPLRKDFSTGSVPVQFKTSPQVG